MQQTRGAQASLVFMNRNLRKRPESFNLDHYSKGCDMSEADSLVLEQLGALRNEILAFRSENQSEFSEIKHRLTRVESSIASMRGEKVGTREFATLRPN